MLPPVLVTSPTAPVSFVVSVLMAALLSLADPNVMRPNKLAGNPKFLHPDSDATGRQEGWRRLLIACLCSALGNGWSRGKLST